MQLFIPGSTGYRFSAARMHAAKYGVGSRIDTTSKVVERFDDNQIAHFVDFIISSHVCTDLPFGEKVLKLSSVVELFIPNTIRNMEPTRIIDQYLLYCKEMCSDFEPLGKSSLFTILETCKASTRKSLQGINYFVAEAGEAFDGIKKMIEDKVALCSDSARLIENLKRARFYLKSDYKLHVMRSSNVADHCCIYALSDPKEHTFAQDCDHEHDESCIECSNLTNTLNDIERVIKETETDQELLDRALKKFRAYRESIEAWKAHLLRSINQDLCRENLLDNLPNNEIYLNLDWVMKFLPVKSREPQSEFFGKRGISWHITVLMTGKANAKDEYNTFDEDTDVLDDSQQISDQEIADLSEENSNYTTVIHQEEKLSFKYKVFVHVFDQCTQDSETVVAILSDVLCRVKETDPQIKKTFVRSDNAGCYHSANTLVSAKIISEKTGITIKRIDFCDPQGGKGPCDRYAAVIKSNVRRYLNENQNVTTASEFVEACHSYKGIKGVLASDCWVEKSQFKKRSNCRIKQITNYHNFEYQVKGLLVHRSWDIGSGLLIPWLRLNQDQTIFSLSLSERESFAHDWVQTKEKPDDENMDVDDFNVNKTESAQTYVKQNNIYQCDVEEGCNAEFIKFGNYINHILIGKHCHVEEKFSLKDTAMKMYHSKLEEVENRRIVSVDMNLTEAVANEANLLPKGWALPVRKPNTEFSEKQRRYLKEKFDEGVFGVKHWKPKEVALDMETLKENGKFYFAAHEILSENQVRSYFRRLKREKQILTTQQSSADQIISREKALNYIDSTNDEDEETDSILRTLEEDLQDTESDVEEITVLEEFSMNAKRALESSLLMNSTVITSSTVSTNNK
ncbi:unnamed protein product [Rotaria sp. Silwood1]|nr:unnamed protein product [Rotaria sp. Silwood1]